MRRITIQQRLGAVLLSLLTVCVLLPAQISVAQTSQVDVAYIASDNDCTATPARPAAPPQPQSAFPYDVTSVCLVIRGSFQDSDSVTAVIYDGAGRVAWHSGPGTFGQWRSYSTTYPSRYRTAVQAEILFRGLQDGQLISTFWPVDRYRVDITLNGPVVVSFTWTVGDVPPLTPTGTATPSPTASTTPVPPSPTATTAPPTP